MFESIITKAQNFRICAAATSKGLLNAVSVVQNHQSIAY